MTINTKLIKSAILTTIIGISTMISPTPAHAQTKSWQGVCVSPTDSTVPTIQGFQCLIANIFSVTLTLLGIIGFVMMVFGAFRWLSSGGNSQATDKARNTMTFAFSGLLLALSSFIIINLIAEFTGVKTILNFVIPHWTTIWS